MIKFRCLRSEVQFYGWQGGVCCGRPLMLADRTRKQGTYYFNSQMIWKSGAHTLVTSCPIVIKCLKRAIISMWKCSYTHLSRDWLMRISENEFLTQESCLSSPCELGRDQYIWWTKMFYIMFPDWEMQFRRWKLTMLRRSLANLK